MFICNCITLKTRSVKKYNSISFNLFQGLILFSLLVVAISTVVFTTSGDGDNALKNISVYPTSERLGITAIYEESPKNLTVEYMLLNGGGCKSATTPLSPGSSFPM